MEQETLIFGFCVIYIFIGVICSAMYDHTTKSLIERTTASEIFVIILIWPVVIVFLIIYVFTILPKTIKTIFDNLIYLFKK